MEHPRKKYNLRKRKYPEKKTDKDKPLQVIPYKRQKMDPDFELSSDSDYSSSEDEAVESVFLSDEEGPSDDKEYFQLDPTPVAKALLNKLIKDFPGFPKDRLLSSILEGLSRVRDDILGDYCGVVPNDSRWKVGMNEEDIQKLEPTLREIRKLINKDKPTLKKILQANILPSTKKLALEIYDILENTEPYTLHAQHLQKRINRLLEDTDNPEKLRKYEEEEKRIKSIVGNPLSRLKKQIFDLNASDEVKAKIYELYLRMEDLKPTSDERATLRHKIMWAVSLPHQNIMLPERRFQDSSLREKASYCHQVFNNLNSKLYGMSSVKERLIQILNNRIQNPKTRSMVALEGLPGTGKTAVAKALAESIGLPFEKISLGGLEDPALLTGQHSSWVGSTPSILLQILKRMKCCNGIVLFDEIDKLSSSERGKTIQNALLHITDYTQNKEFQDSYLYEFPHDLSQIWFMFAMNDRKGIDPVLQDRLDIIRLEKYNQREKSVILQRYILPAVLQDIGFDSEAITMSEQACNTVLSLLEPQMKNTGLRAVEKELHRMVSKIHLFYTNQYSESKIELSYNLPEFEGFPHRITSSQIHHLWSDPKVNLNYLSMYG